MELTSPAFGDGTTIPTQYTCSGAGNAPALQWNAPPSGTVQLAVVVFDPDASANGFVHYLAWGMDPGLRGLAENGYNQGVLGANGLGRQGWIPPCPPPGDEPHRYEFTAYALDRDPALAPGADITAFRTAAGNHILSQATVTGSFGR
jgi:Raf kinase inhibitor-like YbhB/YbcL family protein